jgi:hypothetical protein
MKRIALLGGLIVIGGLSMTAAGLQGEGRGQGRGEGRGRGPQGPPVLQIEKVKDDLYEITGPGAGNSAAFITSNGVVLVDTKLPGSGQAILDKIKTVTDKPVVEIINTHSHPDHTGSNEYWHPQIAIVAHENTKANMERMDNFKGEKAAYLPKTTFKDQLIIGSGKEEIDLYYFGRAHTSGDAWVVFKADRVLHSGGIRGHGRAAHRREQRRQRRRVRQDARESVQGNQGRRLDHHRPCEQADEDVRPEGLRGL